MRTCTCTCTWSCTMCNLSRQGNLIYMPTSVCYTDLPPNTLCSRQVTFVYLAPTVYTCTCEGSCGSLINPRRACAARVTVVGFSVCPLVANSLQERLFVFKPLSHTLRATKVKTFVGFSLKPLRCRDPALPPLYGHAYSRPFFHAYFSCTRMRISRAHDTRA